MRIACRRGLKGVDFTLMPENVYHDKQVEKTFDQDSTEMVQQMKSWGSKVMKLSDIMERKDTRDTKLGRVVRVPGTGRQRAAVVYPALPLRTFARMSPQARSQLALQDVGTPASPGVDDELAEGLADGMPSVSGSLVCPSPRVRCRHTAAPSNR